MTEQKEPNIYTIPDKKLIDKGYEKFNIYQRNQLCGIGFRMKTIQNNRITFYFDIKTVDINHPVDFEILSIIIDKCIEMGWDYEETVQDQN